MRLTIVTEVVGGVLAVSSGVSAQCQLTNPSFELTSGSSALEWNQFGQTAIDTSLANHGSKAAAAIAPSSGESGFWQQLNASTGQRFDVNCFVATTNSAPLVNGATGVVRVEWFSGSSMISSEEHTVLDDTASPGVFTEFSLTTNPAPSGTSKARLVLVARGNGGSAGRVVFDQVFFDTQGRLASIQWGDFPSGRTIQFAGYTWRVKGNGSIVYGPGPNVFDNSSAAVDVQADGLRMSIRNVGGTYKSTEVALRDPLGYGDYIFTTKGDLDQLHHNVVLGLFTWNYPVCWEASNPWNLHNEIDVEIAKWGDPQNSNAQFVAQPYDVSGNISRFDINYLSNTELVSYALRWLPDRLEGRVWRGGPDDESPGTIIRTWTYTGPHLPRPAPELPRVHINLWHIAPPSGNQEVIINDFRFQGLGPATGACCDGLNCTIELEADCASAGGAYQGDNSDCAQVQCTTDAEIELRVVTPFPDLSTGPAVVNDPASGVDLLVQARVSNDVSATGLVAFDGLLADDGSGAFSPAALTSLEALGFDTGGLDPLGRTGMFPSYRATIAENNEDPGNGQPFGPDWAYLPLNLAFSGNGEGINGMWADVYKFRWSSVDTSTRTVLLDATATLGGYQNPIGLQEPIPVAGDTFTLSVEPGGCLCEFTSDSTVNINDMLEFLSLWFAGNSGADVTGDSIVNIDDLLAFLACWFPASEGAACP